MNSDFDIDVLNVELGELPNIDMEQYGFDLDLNLDDEGEYIFEQKDEEKEKNIIDPESTMYIGSVSLFGETGDTICLCTINKDLANKLLDIVKENGEEYINNKVLEVLNDL